MSDEAGLALIQGGKTSLKLILLDLKMPGMDGLEILRKIRNDESSRSIPVIMATHSDLPTDEQAAIKAGADRLMHKATDLDKFKKDMEFVFGSLVGCVTSFNLFFAPKKRFPMPF